MARNEPNGAALIFAALPALIAATACQPGAAAQNRKTSTAMATRATPTPQHKPAALLQIDSAEGRWLVPLEDSEATRDLIAQLPLTLALEDFGATEKIAMLPRKLRHADAPDGVTPVTGDVAYYAPWGNLAIFRKDFRYSTGLVRLGRIAGPLSALRRSGALTVTLRAAPGSAGAPE